MRKMSSIKRSSFCPAALAEIAPPPLRKECTESSPLGRQGNCLAPPRSRIRPKDTTDAFRQTLPRDEREHPHDVTCLYLRRLVKRVNTTGRAPRCRRPYDECANKIRTAADPRQPNALSGTHADALFDRPANARQKSSGRRTRL